MRISRRELLLTMVGGRIVHDGGTPRSAVPVQQEARGFVPPGGCHCAEAGV